MYLLNGHLSYFTNLLILNIYRYKTLLENEKQKVLELEQFRKATDRSELETLLDNTREEKEKLEEKLTNIQEELAVSGSQVIIISRGVTGTDFSSWLLVCTYLPQVRISEIYLRLVRTNMSLPV